MSLLFLSYQWRDTSKQAEKYIACAHELRNSDCTHYPPLAYPHIKAQGGLDLVWMLASMEVSFVRLQAHLKWCTKPSLVSVVAALEPAQGAKKIP